MKDDMLKEREQEKQEILQRANESKTGDPWLVQEDYALIKAIKKFPVQTMNDKKSDHRVAIINDGRPLPSM